MSDEIDRLEREMTAAGEFDIPDMQEDEASTPEELEWEEEQKTWYAWFECGCGEPGITEIPNDKLVCLKHGEPLYLPTPSELPAAEIFQESLQELLEATIKLMDHDPHNLRDTRPCGTCRNIRKAMKSASEIIVVACPCRIQPCIEKRAESRGFHLEGCEHANPNS